MRLQQLLYTPFVLAAYQPISPIKIELKTQTLSIFQEVKLNQFWSSVRNLSNFVTSDVLSPFVCRYQITLRTVLLIKIFQ